MTAFNQYLLQMQHPASRRRTVLSLISCLRFSFLSYTFFPVLCIYSVFRVLRLLVPISKEFFNPLISQRVFHQLTEHFIWKCRNMCTIHGGICYMQWMSDGRSNDLRPNMMTVKNFRNRGNQVHAIMTDVVQTSEER